MSNSLFRKKNIDTILQDAAKGDADAHGHGLRRVLTLKDLTFFGIAAIIGAGSFSSLAGAVNSGGPGVVVLFIICGIACGFTAFCYAEFASRIPVAGSAYTYAYASFGELFAWIIGWALLMEYSIGNIYVAFSWSDYFTSLMDKIGFHIPDHFTCSYKEAQVAFNDYIGADAAGKAAFLEKSANVQLLSAWNNSPVLGSLRLIVDIPALVINMLITYLVFRGIKESRNFSNVMVILKLAVVALVILVGGAMIFSNGTTGNWTPPDAAGGNSFMPNGFGGVMAAVSGVFFAYIGFDAVSVLAEESKNPQRDLPKGMILSLIICTIVYILLALVLTGAVVYSKFENVGDPLAFIFEKENLNIPWMQVLVAICAVIAMTSVLLVFQMGQPRIWMSMSRDGLLPKKFQTIHPRFKTPSFATILTGFLVGVPILFTDKNFVLDFTSIGTLFAFVLVCGGVLMLPRRQKEPGKFNLPYVNSKYIFPLLLAGVLALLLSLSPGYFKNLFSLSLNADERTEVVNGYASVQAAGPASGLLFSSDIDKVPENGKTREPLKAAAKNALAANDSLHVALDEVFTKHLAQKPIYTAIINNTYSTGQLATAPFSDLDVPAASAAIADFLIRSKDSLQLMTAQQFDTLKSYVPAADTNLLRKFQHQQAFNQAIAAASDSGRAILASWVQTNLFGVEHTAALAKTDMTGVKDGINEAAVARKTANISTLIFWLVCVLLAGFGLAKNWSLIPVMGLISCLYLLTGMSASNWKWFFIWFAIGFVVYMAYGYRKSKLAPKTAA